MRLSVIFRYIGIVMLFLALFMLASAGVSYINHVDTAFYPLLISFMLTLVLGVFPLIFVNKDPNATMTTKESYCIVVGAWLLACVVGMFPYLIWGGEFSLINAWFESVSGFSCTGASILNDIEALPRGLLFWRSTTNWIGGVGVVIFAMMILPTLGRNRAMLTNIEMSAMAKDNYHYRSQQLIRILITTYICVTLLCMFALKLAGMTWFDACTHAMSTVSTAGFSTKNASVGHFDSVAIELILIVTMFVSAIHYGLLFSTLTGKRNNIFRSEVVKTYFVVLVASSVLIAVSLRLADVYPTLLSSFRHSLFQVVSISTTTGFATTDTNLWTPLAVMILVVLSLTGACAGSTSGGLKFDRLILAAKSVKARIVQQQHPNAIVRIKIDGVIQRTDTVSTVMTFIVFYILLILIGVFVNSLYGIDLTTGFSSAVACVSNVGPGFGEVGSVCNFSSLPSMVKFTDTLLMLFGRLEIFGLIQIFLIKWWI
ncbi:MAG: TrkH family potassium uptake protein [Rikenellaceae bacterium]|nr:TrkH family potassium uptake protein [Rikenellaceae bacterium]MBR4055702.1 TrkH family potassium uptake protein [Rikenellaceae bacterium]